MQTSSLQNKNVRELQQLAREAPIDRTRTPRKQLSRAARLHLIDILSRWSATGLALIGGVSIYLAITAGRAYPVRAAAWVAMTLCALWVCRRLRSRFRGGNAMTSRPFRWRASYTSCLSVLGVVFASAPILLTPAGAAESLFLQVAGLTLAAGTGAAMLHTAHLASAASFAAPAALFTVFAGARLGDISLLAAGSAVALFCGVSVILVNRAIIVDAARQYPRTGFLRGEVSSARGHSHARPRPNLAKNAL